MAETVTLAKALNEGLRRSLESDPKTLLLGEDIGKLGGVFRVTDGLQKDFGEHRVVDTPLAESSILGAAIGLAMRGYRPVVEIQFDGFVYVAFDQIVSQLAKMHARSGGAVRMPVTVRLPYGGGIGAVEHHSESPEAYFAHTAGLRVVSPSNPVDGYWMVQQAVACDDPVIFLEPKRIYNGPFDGHHERPIVPWSGNPLAEVPDGHYTVPLESAKAIREGNAVTVLTYGTMVWVAEAAARETGVDAEIIDLRSLWPLDLDMIVASVNRTGRCVIVHEATRTSGFGAELAALVQEHCFFHLEAPIERVTGWDTPYPHAQEWAYFPGPDRVGKALRRTLET
jgi:2-oxoisovalerate dehydrogenase E1 component beta subunit